MSRVDNWRTLLADFIESRRERPFVWGQHDCCLFAADWIALATGHDPAEWARGKYDSALSAHRLAAPYGGVGGLVSHCLIQAKASSVQMPFVKAGDIIIRDSLHGDCVGIVLGQNAAFIGEFGLSFTSTTGDPYADFWTF